MKILVACEESQEVCKAFREKGHEAYSCDIIEPSGGHPEWHILGDALPLLDGNCTFRTMAGAEHYAVKWDMIIAFPPCTHLASSGAAWFKAKQKDGRQQKAIDFFLRFAAADCPKIAIENPVGIMSTRWRKPDQIIHPWMFGHPEKKATCLWLKGLPLLTPTNDVSEHMKTLPKNQQERLHYLPQSPDRAKIRSKTFPGLAKAMASQWSGI